MKSQDLEKPVRAEYLSHVEDDVLAESYKLKNRFNYIWTYPSKLRYDDKFKSYLTDLSGKSILDYGCGRGLASVEYLKQGAHVCGIDISPPYIDECNELAQAVTAESGSFNFRVMDAHKLDFPDNTFGIVAGN